MLPEPLLPPLLLESRASIQRLPELARNTLLTVLSFFAQLTARHGCRGDFLPRLAFALSHAEVDPEPLSDWTRELEQERRFPPLEAIGRYT